MKKIILTVFLGLIFIANFSVCNATENSNLSTEILPIANDTSENFLKKFSDHMKSTSDDPLLFTGLISNSSNASAMQLNLLGITKKTTCKFCQYGLNFDDGFRPAGIMYFTETPDNEIYFIMLDAASPKLTETAIGLSLLILYQLGVSEAELKQGLKELAEKGDKHEPLTVAIWSESQNRYFHLRINQISTVQIMATNNGKY